MSPGRRGPLSFLDTEWRAALWRRWLATQLTEAATRVAPESAAQSPVPAASTPVPTPIIEAPEAPTVEASKPLDVPKTSADVLRAAQAVHAVRATSAVDERRNERRADLRARFDALSERLQGLEDALDVIARRLSHRSRRERRTDRRTAELVESIAESVDAQGVQLENLASTLERIERRLDRLERPNTIARDESERRESRAPKARHSEPPRTLHPPRMDEAADFSLGRELSEDDEPSLSGSSIRGSIGDMSLSTVLAMLEIERRSGRLKVQGEDGSLVAFELEEGSVVGSRASENDVDPVESLRSVLGWKNGRFWFRQNPSESQISAPRSVNSLLLEATRQMDEAIRAG